MFCCLGDLIGTEEASRASVRCAWSNFRELAPPLTSRGASLILKGKVHCKNDVTGLSTSLSAVMQAWLGLTFWRAVANIHLENILTVKVYLNTVLATTITCGLISTIEGGCETFNSFIINVLLYVQIFINSNYCS